MLQELFLTEQEWLLWIQDNIRNPWMTKIFVFITTLGNGGIVWILLSFGLMIPKKTRKIGFLSLLSLGICAVINNLFLKNMIARTRPYEVISGLKSLVGIQKDYSFPSGHTAASFASAIVLFKTLPAKYGIPPLVLAFLMGFSRMYVGVHYPSDVLGGAMIGSIIAMIVLKIGTKEKE